MITATIRRIIYADGNPGPVDISVRVYQGDDLPSHLIALVDGFDLDQKLERALRIARLFETDTQVVAVYRDAEDSLRQHYDREIARLVARLDPTPVPRRDDGTIGTPNRPVVFE